MKQYFIELKGKRVGPLDLEMVRSHEISGETLVWSEGMTNWVEASSHEDLRGVIYVDPPPPNGPPPLPIEEIPSLLLAGFGFLLLNIIATILTRTNQFEVNMGMVALVTLFIRIYSTYLVVKKAKILKKGTFYWGLFTFFLPIVGLLILGFTRKKNPHN